MIQEQAPRHSRHNPKALPFDKVSTPGQALDANPPVISSLSSGVPNANDATITWTTDFVADSQVFWGLTTAYAGATSPIMNFTYGTSHSVQITGLAGATLYHYKVLTRRPGGAYAFSADGTFTTA